jgi:hypothetical protein
MKRFHAFEWNKHDKEFTMVFLDDEDVQNEIPTRGAGIDILVLPKRYESSSRDYIKLLVHIVTCRNGKIIYV